MQNKYLFRKCKILFQCRNLNYYLIQTARPVIKEGRQASRSIRKQYKNGV